MKRYLLIIFISAISLFIFNSFVNADDIDINVDYGDGSGSVACSTGICAGTDFSYFGMRITLMKKNGSRLENTGISSNLNNSNFSFNTPVPCNKGELNFCYQNYTDNLDADELEKILLRMGSNIEEAQEQDYYLVVEPLLRIRYTRYGTVMYRTEGDKTITEVVNEWLNYFTVGSADATYSRGFLDGSYGWNVIKNYYTIINVRDGISPYTRNLGSSTTTIKFADENGSTKNGKFLISVNDIVRRHPSGTPVREDSSCLSANHSYTQYVTDIGGNKGRCNVEIKLTNNLNASLLSATAGQLVMKFDDGIIANSTIKVSCLTYHCQKDENDKIVCARTSNQINLGSYTNYLKNLYLGREGSLSSDDLLVPSANPSIEVTSGGSSEYSVSYKLKGVYANNGDGSIIYNESCTNCKFLGYGKITLLNESGDNRFQFEYSYRFKSNMKTSSNNYCNYRVEPEIVTCKTGHCNSGDNPQKLNLEFRSIDVNNPFPGKSGNQRTPGSNWKNVDRDDILLNSPNSYGIILSSNTNKGAKYEIILTPKDIEDIRNYNKNNNYDDYNLTCIDDICTSNYLTTLYNEGLLKINNSSKRNLHNLSEIKP